MSHLPRIAVAALTAALLLSLPSPVRAQTLDVVLNEIAWMGSTGSSSDEWIELYNNTASDIDLTGWTLNAADGTPSITLAGTIPAGGHFLLERTDDSTVPGVAADQIYTGGMGNAGEVLDLRDLSSTLQDKVDAWHAGVSGTRQTMQRVDTTLPGTQASNWTDGPVDGTPTNGGGGSGGECDPVLNVVDCQIDPPFQFHSGAMVINEVMINPAAVGDAAGEYVELFNAGSTTVDIQGWVLRDDDFNSFTIPTGSPVNVAPGATFLIAANGDPGLNGGFTPDLVWTNFALSNSGDEVVLEDGATVEQDRLVYSAPPFTDSFAASLERVSPRLPTSDILSWSEAGASFGLGDRGTPGAVNTLQSRRYVLRGTLATMDESLPEQDRVFAGAVYVQGNRIMDVVADPDPLPPDAAGATLVETGALIFPDS